ncbi:polysaccharide lyase [Bombiscardovia nodaiensis]|uniref:Polysaccharide lyase n=1 Tax=Bombiscardovia nodaiensis TaxID=2932181 RepID=A0ABM8B958_9BIFI|nr:polysaccharide lyase [Bombiscardovia nodaiensis]
MGKGQLVRRRNVRRIAVAAVALVTSLAMIVGVWVGRQPAAYASESDQVLANLQTELVGRANNPPDSAVTTIIASKEQALQNDVLDKLVLSDPNKLFSDLTAWKTASDQLNSMADNMVQMAVLYQTPESRYYHQSDLKDKIVAAWQWFTSKAYSESSRTYGNWWHFEIGVPIDFVKVLDLTRDFWSPQDMQGYQRIFKRFIPNPAKRLNGVTETGANLLDKCYASLIMGVLAGDDTQENQALASMGTAFAQVTSGDGFYADGSFIQHSTVPYNGGYGAVLLGKVASLVNMFQGSRKLASISWLSSVYQYLDDSFLPLMYREQLMDLTRGRGVSRQAAESSLSGRDMLVDFAIISQGNPDAAYQRKYSGMINEALAAVSDLGQYYDGLSIFAIQTLQKIRQDNLHPAQPYTLNKMYARNAQMVQHNGKYSAAVSMFAPDVSSFEFGNNENKKGFYQGAGALYVFNGDHPYDDGYWPTVDPTALEGVTTDHQLGRLINWHNYANTESWAGGVSDGSNGFASLSESMSQVTGSPLKAKKSWFFLGDKIVALGAGINSTDASKAVETSVLNRKIDAAAGQTLSVDGQTITAEQALTNPHWALLSSQNATDNLGVTFLQNAQVSTARKTQTGSWSGINTGESPTPITREYATLALEHGNAPASATYAYSLLPGASQTELAQESTTPTVQVLKNDADQQAIVDLETHTTMIAFQSAGSVDSITANTPGALMKRPQGQETVYTVADPSRSQSTLSFDVPKNGARSVRADDSRVTVADLGNSFRVTVNTASKDGRSIAFALSGQQAQDWQISEQVGWGTITSPSGFGIKTWTSPDQRTWTRQLPKGTVWKFFKVAKKGTKTMYNLGGNRWVDARYFVPKS